MYSRCKGALCIYEVLQEVEIRNTLMAVLVPKVLDVLSGSDCSRAFMSRVCEWKTFLCPESMKVHKPLPRVLTDEAGLSVVMMHS